MRRSRLYREKINRLRKKSRKKDHKQKLEFPKDSIKTTKKYKYKEQIYFNYKIYDNNSNYSKKEVDTYKMN